MEIKINTKSKTITILGDTTVKELVEFLKSYEDWTIIQPNNNQISIRELDKNHWIQEPYKSPLSPPYKVTFDTATPLIKGNVSTSTIFNPEKGNWSYTTTLGNER
jgi:hypothetical protein